MVEMKNPNKTGKKDLRFKAEVHIEQQEDGEIYFFMHLADSSEIFAVSVKGESWEGEAGSLFDGGYVSGETLKALRSSYGALFEEVADSDFEAILEEEEKEEAGPLAESSDFMSRKAEGEILSALFRHLKVDSWKKRHQAVRAYNDILKTIDREIEEIREEMAPPTPQSVYKAEMY